MLLLLPVVLTLQAQPTNQVKAVARHFQASIASNDIDSLAAITRFPIESNEFGVIRDRADLKRRYREIFTEARRRGLAGQAVVPLLNGVNALSSRDQSDPIQFLFKRFGDRVLFYCIDNVNE